MATLFAAIAAITIMEHRGYICSSSGHCHSIFYRIIDKNKRGIYSTTTTIDRHMFGHLDLPNANHK